MVNLNKEEKIMDVTGFLAIGNGEKCPFCIKIMEDLKAL